jgi:hypothetical protein
MEITRRLDEHRRNFMNAERLEQLYGHNPNWKHYTSRAHYLSRVRQLKSTGRKSLPKVVLHT